MRFQYILEKINTAPIIEDPFPHLEIQNIFEQADFNKIIESDDIKLPPAINDANLFDILFDKGYRIIEFPGCTENYKEYINWHSNKKITRKTNTACEGFGVVLRQENPGSEAVKELVRFLKSRDFVECLARKFSIESYSFTHDYGIQKYLDGYEISPHPDIRRKALTYMVNINPDIRSHSYNHHTHYLKFKKEFDYVRTYWQGNPEIDTCWVPWEWCNTYKCQTENNSMVIFSPGADTLHAVKADYDHLANQRTQLYGNLWYENSPATVFGTKWENLQLNTKQNQSAKLNYRSVLSRFLTGKKLKNIKQKNTGVTHSKRNTR